MAAGATLGDAYVATVAWLEASQNSDGSWGDGATAPMVTAEVVYALARAGRAGAPPAQKGMAWLRSQELGSVDYRARAIRALEAAGVDVRPDAVVLTQLRAGEPGWGPVGGTGISALDTALALNALKAAGVALVGEAEVGARATTITLPVSGGSGALWLGEDVPTDEVAQAAEGSLGLSVTAEIVRAMEYAEGTGVDQAPYLAGLAALAGDEYAPDCAGDLLDVALRLVARHAWERVSPVLESELLDDTCFGAPVSIPPPGSGMVRYWDSADPLVHALGLLAIRTKPGFSPPAPGGGEDDLDGDTVMDDVDAFPFDPFRSADLDGDGIADADESGPGDDLDGDGVPNGLDAFHTDPTEWADSDGDGIGDNADDEVDDDDDGLTDVAERAQGSDPTESDTDGDGWGDGEDACPVVASGGPLDSDLDGVCDEDDDCPTDPLEVADLDGDLVCDNADADDDGDTFTDVEELAFGSDPRDAASNPAAYFLADDPTGDFDSDGLANAAELTIHGSSPILLDTDSDGASDGHEVAEGTLPYSAASQPKPSIAVFGAVTPANLPLVEVTGFQHSLTGGQPTPVASGAGVPSSGGGLVNQAGFQPQAGLGRDLDGDGLAGAAENAQRTSDARVDTDGDGFVDGSGGLVAKTRYPEGRDLRPDPQSPADGFVDGEADAGTDPANPDDHVGKAGDVAPLLHPDGKVGAADAAVLLRIVADPSLLEDGGSDNQLVSEGAADVNGDGAIGANDAGLVLREAAQGD